MLFGKNSSKGGRLSIDIFKPWSMGDQRYRPKGGRFVDYWTFKPEDKNADHQLKQVVFWWDSVFKVIETP